MNRDITQDLRSKCTAIENQCSWYIHELERGVEDRKNEIQRLRKRLQAESISLRQEISESAPHGKIIGNSLAIRRVVAQIERVAPTNANVLIEGESGTGKELVALEIHKRSNLRHRPLIKVNCAAIPGELYESEFFGHVKGAFTGAVHDRIGRFEAADGGSLFLDEVGEIPLGLQSKLLRVLQEGEFERVGEGVTRKVDVRIIATSNKPLFREVRARRFRDDLFYRLNVFPIQVPPLRERKDDIRLLALHFVDRLSKQLDVPKQELTRANVHDLQAYEWPGNVRELENAIARALILSSPAPLDFTALNKAPLPNKSPPAKVYQNTESPITVLSSEEMKRFERDNTILALRRCRWKIYGDDGAARLLGINPTTLIERMKRMRIQKPPKRNERSIGRHR